MAIMIVLMVDIKQLANKFVSESDPQYIQVIEFLWQYLLMEAASTVPVERLNKIIGEILEHSHTSPITREEILAKYYPEFLVNIESYINKFFQEYV